MKTKHHMSSPFLKKDAHKVAKRLRALGFTANVWRTDQLEVRYDMQGNDSGVLRDYETALEFIAVLS